MAGTIDARLREKGIELPEAASPVANYVPWTVTGNLAFISGQLPFRDGELEYPGRFGENISMEDGVSAARLCGLNLVAQLRNACGGDLDRVAQAVKLTGYVNSAPDFTDQAAVMNGCSDLIFEIFEDKGRHARAAVGCSTLPLGAAVEVDGVFEIS